MLFHSLGATVLVSYKFTYGYLEVAKRAPNSDAGVVISEVYSAVFGRDLTPEQIAEVGRRLSGWAEQARKDSIKLTPVNTKTPPPKEKITNLYGQRYRSWFKELGFDATLLWLADWDPQKAEYFYSSVDRDLVDMAIENKIRQTEEMNHLLYEGPLFAFGGGYGKGKRKPGSAQANETVREHDLSKASLSEIQAKMKAFSQRG